MAVPNIHPKTNNANIADALKAYMADFSVKLTTERSGNLYYQTVYNLQYPFLRLAFMRIYR